MPRNDLCFVGLENLPVLAPEFNRLGAGGEQVQQTLLSRALANRGVRVAMVVLDHGQADGAAWDGIETFKAYRPDAGLRGIRFMHPRWTGIWQAMSRADAKTYYVSCAGMRVGLAAMFCRLKGRRLVFRVAHDSDCRPHELLVRLARDRALYNYGLKRADAILVQSERQQADLRHYYGLQGAIARMLVESPAGIRDCSDRTIDVLWVNNLAQFKRPDLIVELARRLPDRRFVVIGGTQPGAEGLARMVRAAAAELSNLNFLGPVPYHKISEYYASARVFVNTSDSEGFPNSYLQSWVRGTPLVAFFDPDGIVAREGLGAVPANMEEMAAAVDGLLRDESAWRDCSGRAVAYMAREFPEDDVLRPYLDAVGCSMQGGADRRKDA